MIRALEEKKNRKQDTTEVIRKLSIYCFQRKNSMKKGTYIIYNKDNTSETRYYRT